VVSHRLHNCSPALRACWHPVALAESITQTPTLVRLLGDPWVVTRLGTELVAFADICPHRGAPLSAGVVDGSVLRCGYHGWAFDPNGSCIDIPALGPTGAVPSRARLTKGHVVELGGLVWLAPDEPVVPLPELPPELPHRYLVSDWNAGAGQMLDNFLDVAHLPFSHAPSFGVPEDATAVDMSVKRDGWTLFVEHHHRAKLVDSDEWAAGTAQPFARAHQFRYDAPFTLRLTIRYDELPDVVTLLFAVQPVDEAHSRLFSSVAHNTAAAARCTPQEGLRRGLMIIAEDRDVLETVPETYLELEPRSELHTRADRSTLALRRVLSDLVAIAAPSPSPVSSSTD